MRIIKLLVCIFLISLQHIYAQYCIPGRFDVPLFDSLDIELIPNITYGEAKNIQGIEQQLLLDIYRPNTISDELTKKPLIVYVHGGSLKGGDKSSEGARDFGFGMAERGYIFASLNYRLGWNDIGECKGDTVSLQYALYRAIQDTKAAVRFLMENADVYGIDTNNIFFGGSSVGCTVIINTAYANQDDYPEYLYDSLGSVDSSSNSFFQHDIHIRGIFAKAAGIQFPDILNNRTVPAIFFHGTCDFTVPYNNGPLFYCERPVEYMHYYGSWYLARLMEEKNIPYALYTNEAYGHDSANNDTVMLYTGNFFKEILCDDLPASQEYYRFNPEGCINTDSVTMLLNSYPNPFGDDLFVSVNAATEQDITIEMYNIAGQLLFHDIKHYEPPITQYSIELENYGLTNGIYFIRFSSGSLIKTEIICRQK